MRLRLPFGLPRPNHRAAPEGRSNQGVVEPLPSPAVRRPRTIGPGLYSNALASWLPAVGQKDRVIQRNAQAMQPWPVLAHQSLAKASTLLGRVQVLASSEIFNIFTVCGLK